MSQPRYRVVEGSQSRHCCFSYTIVDLHRPEMIGGEQFEDSNGVPQFEEICECFFRADADRVCAALNATEGGAP